jgi:hypothetical protein
MKWRGQGACPSRGWRSPRCSRPDTRPRGKERRRVGGHSRRRSPLGLVRPDRDRQARRSYARAGHEVSLGGIGSALSRIFWPACLIPSNARQEGEPAVCLSQSVQHRRDKPKVQAKKSQGAQLKPMDNCPAHIVPPDCIVAASSKSRRVARSATWRVLVNLVRFVTASSSRSPSKLVCHRRYATRGRDCRLSPTSSGEFRSFSRRCRVARRPIRENATCVERKRAASGVVLEM